MPYGKRDETYKYPQQYYMWGIDKALLNVLSIVDHIKAPYVIPSNSNINQGLLLSLER